MQSVKAWRDENERVNYAQKRRAEATRNERVTSILQL
jgi:hypothetical protein